MDELHGTAKVHIVHKSYAAFLCDELLFLGGTFLPSRRASDNPMAIACLRLFTFLPLRPDFSLPRLNSCISRPTVLLAPRLYLRPEDLRLLDELLLRELRLWLRELERCLVAIVELCLLKHFAISQIGDL